MAAGFQLRAARRELFLRRPEAGLGGVRASGALAGGIAVWECQDEKWLWPCSDARLRRWRVIPPTLVLFIGGRSGLGNGRGIAGLRDVVGEAGSESDRLLDHGWWAGYSLCSTRAGAFRVAVSPGRAAMTAAAASQLAAMIDSTAAGTATTGVMPS
jgi:hypothetical protein